MKLINPGNARILYKACPLCKSAKIKDLRKGSCLQHPLYHSQLGADIQWRICNNCGHVFTNGYFKPEALSLLFSRALLCQTPGVKVEAKRVVFAKIVKEVSRARGSSEGTWLDVGFGDGSLLTTAAEFGYTVTGCDTRSGVVEKMQEFGYRDVFCEDFMDFDRANPFDVISMADLLEHIPYPKEALRHAKKLLREDGFLFVSTPNMGSFVWEALDRAENNPYWNEIEHYHNFTREILHKLLEEVGFSVRQYDISLRYRACMEIIARGL